MPLIQISFFPSNLGNSQENSWTPEVQTNINSFSSLEEEKKNIITQTNGSYEWIWDELEDADGYLDGDDPMIWGGSLGPYHNYTELTNKLQSLNATFPDLVDMFSIGKSYQDRDLWVVRLTQESQLTAKTEFFIVAHHHGREAITIENALLIIDRIIYLATEGSQENKTWALSLLKNKEIYVLPSLNPDTLSVLPWFPWVRKNLRPIDEDGDGITIDETEFADLNGDNYLGYILEDPEHFECLDGPDDDTTCDDFPGGVDLNRNYAEHWGDRAVERWIHYPQYWSYGGTSAFSEPETQAVRSFVFGHDFNYALSLHSGVKATIAPWGFTNEPPPNSEELYAIRDKLVNITGYINWDDLDSPYFVAGDWGDWMYAYKGIKAFTLETYGNDSSVRIVPPIGFDPSMELGIWGMFNPDGDQILNESEPVWDGAKYLLSGPHLTLNNSLPSVSILEETLLTFYAFGNLDDFRFTVNWTATDSDGDKLLSNVYLRRKGDIDWVLIIKDSTKTSVELTHQFIAPRTDYYIKISVTDGIDYVFDATTYTFRVEYYPGLDTTTQTTTSAITTTTTTTTTETGDGGLVPGFTLLALVVPLLVLVIRRRYQN